MFNSPHWLSKISVLKSIKKHTKNKMENEDGARRIVDVILNGYESARKGGEKGV